MKQRNKISHVWSLPPHENALFSKYFVFSGKPVPRSSHRRCSVKKMLLGIFLKFYTKTLVLESLLNKVAGLKTRYFIKKDSNAGVFLWNFRKFLEYPLWRTFANGQMCLRKINPLLVLRLPYGKWHNWATNTFYWKYEPHEVILCNIHVYQHAFCDFFQATEEN